MGQRGYKVCKTISLDTVEDADILRFLDSQDNESRVWREALRTFMTGEIRLVDVYKEVQALRDEVKRLSTVTVIPDVPQNGSESDEPADIAAALTRFG